MRVRACFTWNIFLWLLLAEFGNRVLGFCGSGYRDSETGRGSLSGPPPRGGEGPLLGGGPLCGDHQSGFSLCLACERGQDGCNTAIGEHAHASVGKGTHCDPPGLFRNHCNARV